MQPTTVPLSAFGSGGDIDDGEDGDEGFCLLQVPSRLPTLASPGASFGGRRSPPAGGAAGARSAGRGRDKLTAASLACASDLRPGSLGKAYVLRSGRIIVRIGEVDFDLSPGLPVDALTTAVLLQPPPPTTTRTTDAPSSPSTDNFGSGGRFFFPSWPPPATPDNAARGAVPLGRVTARATLVPCLDAALPEAASDLLERKDEKRSSGGSGSSSSSSLSSSSADDGDSGSEGAGERRRRRRREKRRPFPRRARGCKLPEQLDEERRRRQEARSAAARTPERAAGKTTATVNAAARAGGGASAGKRRVVEEDSD